MTKAAEAFPAPQHNHAPCVSHALDRAQRAFDTQGLKLTELRKRVIEEIAGSHHAVGAYDVPYRLAEKGSRLAPISAYRAIDWLVVSGVIHLLECQNAF